MLRRKCAAQVSAKNIQVVNQKKIKRNNDDINSEFIQYHPKKGSAVVAQTISPSRKITPHTSNFPTDLNSELADFCA